MVSSGILHILLCLLSLSFTKPVTGNPFLSTSHTITTNYGTYDSLPAAYRSKEFNVQFSVELNLTSTRDVTFRLEFPGDTYTAKSNCKYKTDGSTFGCSTGKDSWTCVPVNINKISVSVEADINYSGVPVRTKLDEHTIEIDLLQAKNDAGGGLARSVVITFPAQISSSCYDAVYDIKIIASSGSDNLEDVAQVRAVGPMLGSVESTTPDSMVTPGDEIDFSIRFSHLGASTEDALTPQLSLSWTQKLAAVPFLDLQYQINGGSKQALTISSTVIKLLPTLAMGDTVTVTGKRSVTDDMLIDVDIQTTVRVDYDNVIGDAYSTLGTSSASTVPVTWNTEQEVVLDGAFPVLGTVSTRRVMLMPRGKLQDIAMFADFSSRYFDEVPFTFQYGRILFPTNTLQHSLPENAYMTPFHEGFAITIDGVLQERKKRAALVSKDVKLTFGDLLNPQIGGEDAASVLIELKWTVGQVSVGGPVGASTGLNYNGNTAYFDSLTGSVNKPVLIINKTVEMENNTALPNIVRFNVTVSHNDTATNAPAFNVQLTEGSNAFKIQFGINSEGPVPGNPELQVVNNDMTMIWTKNELNDSSEMHMSYRAETTADLLPEGYSYYTASVNWNSSALGGEKLGPVSSTVCILREDVIIESLFFNHGFTALGLIVGLLVGAVIVILIILLLWKLRRLPFGRVGPMSKSNAHKSEVSKHAGKGLVTDSKNNWKDLRQAHAASQGESLVAVLALDDGFKQERELGNLDIGSTITVDMQIEDERDKAMAEATVYLVTSLQHNGDIPKKVAESASSAFQKNIANIEKSMEKDYQKELGDVFKKLSAKNRNKLSEMSARHAQEREDLNQQLAGLTEEEKREIKTLQAEQHEAEITDLNYRLRLEQDEEAEKLRKEFCIRRRMAIKAAQQQYLDNVRQQGKLSDIQIDWLMKEHHKNQAGLDKLYDDEISRQRMSLEEKLARRRALAQAMELQKENHSELLNTLADHQVSSIQKAKKEGTLSPEEARRMIAGVQEDMLSTKQKLDEERERQEQALHKKLSDRKKQKMAELSKKHAEDEGELTKKHKSMQTEGLDPLSVIEARQTQLALHRAEMAELENELDKDAADELIQLREEVVTQTKTQLQESKEKLFEEMERKGMDEDAIAKILKKHEKDLAHLHAQQEEDRQAQMNNFKKRLMSKRAGASAATSQEAEEQAALREHEDAIVRKLVDNQMALSEADREKILQQHEQDMVKLENSLTLSKLQQKRLLEEKIAKKKAAQLEQLQRKQAVAIRRRKMAEKARAADSEGDSEEEEKEHQRRLNMIKKHAAERMAVTQGDNLQMENELQEIENELVKERATILKEQEVRLAATMAQLQMEKAKEVAKMESQQKAIHELKASLLDELNQNGKLSDPACQKVLQIHQEEQDKLNKKLDKQRDKQEQAFRRRLQERMAQKEAQISALQKQEMDDAGLGKLGNTPAARIRRAAILHKHTVELEEFRNRMDREISQNLEEMRRQNEVNRSKAIQDQELQFLNGLVRLGKFEMSELDSVLQMLFPAKSEAQRKELMTQLCEGVTPASPKKDGRGGAPGERPTLDRRRSTLVDRVQSATLSRVPPSALPQTPATPGLSKRQLKHRGSSSGLQGRRPEPLGRSQSPETWDSLPSKKLPPLETSGKKKKKKKKQPQVSYYEEDEDDQDGF